MTRERDPVDVRRALEWFNEARQSNWEPVARHAAALIEDRAALAARVQELEAAISECPTCGATDA